MVTGLHQVPSEVDLVQDLVMVGDTFSQLLLFLLRLTIAI